MSSKSKVILARYMGPEAQKILEDDKSIEVSILHASSFRVYLGCADMVSDVMQVVMWPEDRPADRSWVLENIKGASGIVCASTEKVSLDSIGMNA